jgi:hypothetical protein
MTAGKNYGRYDRVEEAVNPGPALPRAPKHMRGKVEIVVAAVEDPNVVGKEKLRRQRVAVNVARDTLEREYAFGRISTAAYQAGRAFERILEAARGRRSRGVAFERSCGAGSQELQILRRVEIAERAIQIQAEVRSIIGEHDERLLRAILGDGLTFEKIAAGEGCQGKRARARVAARFREALRVLAMEWGRGGGEFGF